MHQPLYPFTYINKNMKIAIRIAFLILIQTMVIRASQPQSNEELIDGKLLMRPRIHNIQIDSFIFFYNFGAGGQVDFDVFSKKDDSFCVGSRLSIEHYYHFNLVDSDNTPPSTNYNLYCRLSANSDHSSFSLLGGLSYFSSDVSNYNNKSFLFRAGFEAKYGSTVSLIFKGSTSFVDNSSFIGIGVSFGYDHLF
jgi:hypothetical protein